MIHIYIHFSTTISITCRKYPIIKVVFLSDECNMKQICNKDLP